MSGNQYAAAARERKASKLIDLLELHRMTHVVHSLDASDWKMLAQAAGVNVPSDDTIALVKERLRRRGAGTVSVEYGPLEIEGGK